MRTFLLFAFALLLHGTASAATLKVEVSRHGFTGPIEVSVAPRVDGKAPEWTATKTLTGARSALSFDVPAGLYVVMTSGPQPLQRLSAKANVGSDGSTLRLAIPRAKTEVRATLAGEPIPHAEITFTHDELRWHTEVETGEDGRFTGELWEPGIYTAGVRHEPASAPHSVDVSLAPKQITIDVPDRHVRGRVLAGGKPLAGAIVQLRSETSESTRTQRTHSAPDGRFEFFGVGEGSLTLTARATSYLDSDAVELELRGAKGERSVDFELTRGEPRAVRVVDARGTPIAGALLIGSCDSHVKSTAFTSAEGRADVALPRGASCAIYAVPKEGSIAVERVEGAKPLLIRVPEGTSSLRLALKSEAGEVFSALSLLMRINGVTVPPSIARLLGSRGFPLVTNEEGSIALQRIPPGTYEFWPYRTSAEGQMLYETATEFDAPIAVKVLTGENNATVRFQAR
jgi:Carboxypeptidase regulatory-like domain